MIATTLLALARRHWGALGIAAALLAALVVVNVRLGVANHNLRAETARADKSAADLGTCHANVASQATAIAAQNAAVDALQRQGQQRAAAAEKALSEAARGRAGAEKRAAYLLAHPPAGIDACSRMEAADAAVLGALK